MDDGAFEGTRAVLGQALDRLGAFLISGFQHRASIAKPMVFVNIPKIRFVG
jgi:hypothetical protein